MKLVKLCSTTGKITAPPLIRSIHMKLSLLTRSSLILCGLLLIVVSITNCSPTTDTTSLSPPDDMMSSNSPPRLANLIKDSNPNISGVSITPDDSDPANLNRLIITGLTNSASGEPSTTTLTINQDQGITTVPASLTITPTAIISPAILTSDLTVTFGNSETPISYTVTTRISGAPVEDWFSTNHISVSFASQSPDLAINENTLSITGLTNIPTGRDDGMISFEKLPSGFSSDQETIQIPNPPGIDPVPNVMPVPSSFKITETGNTENSGTYMIAPIDLARLSQFTPSVHIQFTEGDRSGEDITSTLTITPDPEDNNIILITGLTNKVDLTAGTPNTYTLAIVEDNTLFTTPGGNDIEITITEPMTDISPKLVIFTETITITNLRKAPTTYRVKVDFSGAAVQSWFTAATFNTYITAAKFAAETGTLMLNDTNLIISGGNDFTNVPNGRIALTLGPIPNGYTLTGANELMDPDRQSLAAVTTGSAGTITITETDNSTNTQAYPVMITLGAYRSPLEGRITATYDGTNADLSAITVETNMITISGFENSTGMSDSNGTITFTLPTPTDYTLSETSLPIPNPEGTINTNWESMITVTDTRDGGVAVSHPITVEFSRVVALRITSADINNGAPLDIGSRGGAITISTLCKLLAMPTIEVTGVTGGKVAETTPFPRYYGAGDTLTSGRYMVDRSLTILDGENNVVAQNFQVTLMFQQCSTFAGGSGANTDPHLIDTAPRLELAASLVNTDATYRLHHYKITADIDMGVPGFPISEADSGSTGEGFTPIGRDNAKFSGNLDCGNNTITRLYINSPDKNDIGLVGSANDAAIQNCYLTAVKITGNERVGGLLGVGVASSVNSSFGIRNSYVTGSVSGSYRVGGLVGHFNNTSGRTTPEIANSYASVAVSGFQAVGGLVGQGGPKNPRSDSTTIKSSYAAGPVTGRAPPTGSSYTAQDIGGLVGHAFFLNVTDVYAAGNVTVSASHIRSGGLIGHARNMILNTYTISSITGNDGVRGFMGSFANAPSLNPASYWATDAPNTAATNGVGIESTSGNYEDYDYGGIEGKTLAELKQAATFPMSWESAVWDIRDGFYPRLKNVPCPNSQYNDAFSGNCSEPLDQ